MSNKVLSVAVLIFFCVCAVAGDVVSKSLSTVEAVKTSPVQPEPTPNHSVQSTQNVQSTHSVQPTLKSVNGTIAPTQTRTTSSASRLGIFSILCTVVVILLL